MQNLKNLLSVLLLTVTFFSCEDPYKDEKFSAYDDTPTAIYLSKQPEYSQWVKMLKRADVYNALNMNHPFTSFAVENDAIDKYLSDNGYATVDDIPLDNLKFLVRYHILPYYEYPFAQLFNEIPTQTASGDFLTVKIGDKPDDKYIGDAKITRPNILVTNGLIHGLDQLLTPTAGSIWDLLSTGRYSIFKAALEECGAQYWLSSRDTTFKNGLSSKIYKTVFAVSDSVFNANGIASVDDIKATYPGSGLDKNSDFYNYVMYHVVNDRLSYTGMLKRYDNKEGTLALKNFPTAAFYPSLITVKDDGKGLIFNATSTNPARCVIGKQEQVARNGLVHEVDALLPVSEPESALFEWEFTDFIELQGIPFYRTNSAARAQSFTIGLDDVKGIYCETVPEDATILSYVSHDKYKNVLYKDFIEADPGIIGKIEFTTPIIAAGRYEVRVVTVNEGVAGGQYLFEVDGVSDSKTYHFGGRDAREVNLGAYSFSANGTHRIGFRIKSGVGGIRVDKVKFIPLT